ncbi:MAG: four helix bundle protein [Bacteroidia bacterium]
MPSQKEIFIEEMKRRTKGFFIASIHVAAKLPENRVGWIMKDQFLRSAGSVGANYRAVCRARSDKEFFAKLSIVVEELDESLYWLETMVESDTVPREHIVKLYKEGNELLSILSKARKSASEKIKNSKNG